MKYIFNLLVFILISSCTQEPAMIIKKGENYYGKNSRVTKHKLEGNNLN